MFASTFACLSVCPTISPFVPYPAHPSVHQHVCSFVLPSVHLSVGLSVCLSLRPSVHRSARFVRSPIRPSACPSVCPFVGPFAVRLTRPTCLLLPTLSRCTDNLWYFHYPCIPPAVKLVAESAVEVRSFFVVVVVIVVMVGFRLLSTPVAVVVSVDRPKKNDGDDVTETDVA